MKKLIPFIIYLIISVLTLFIPASEGYDTLLWKFIIGQVISLPVLIVSIILFVILSKKNKQKN